MIVITGSSGQVGSELKKQLKLNNHPYKAFDKISLDITSKNSIKSNLDKIKNLKVIINLLHILMSRNVRKNHHLIKK